MDLLRFSLFSTFFSSFKNETGQQSLRTAWSTYYTNTEVRKHIVYILFSMQLLHGAYNN